MPLVVHDTLARGKRAFVPADPQRVTMYVCGPTVWNYVHIGNARPAVIFDVLFRRLRAIYGEQAVIYARNVTDVDDKIIAKAAEEGVTAEAVAERFLAGYREDMAGLGCLTPSLEPRATEHVPQMIGQIERIVAGGRAYAAEGHALFDTQAFAEYGALSGRSLDDMIAGARVEVAPYKKHPADFVLWKPAKGGEPAWDSPWGAGRPGWHIECSAMIEANLGLPIDLHGGGHDLIFPHHENEIAQGRCASQGTEYARYWMHNGFLTMDAEKMSKSLGNVVLVHDLLARIPGEVLRYALLSAHYRAPLDWTDALVDQARASLDRLYRTLSDAKRELAGSPARAASDRVEEATSPVLTALDDDLNTPRALAGLHELAQGLRQALSSRSGDAALLRAALLESGASLGLLQADPDGWFEVGVEPALRERIEGLVAERTDARSRKDWAAADRLRSELTDLGVEVMDGAGGATWRFKG
jgi:cysteinyl-tRNA synthetase